jgi:hypothetical protein
VTFSVARFPITLQPKGPPDSLRQIEQKQYMKGTGVSDSTLKVTFPH